MFEPTNTAEIASILANKTCALDPLPTKQLKDNIDSIVPIVTCITNASLVNAVVSALHGAGRAGPLHNFEGRAEPGPTYCGPGLKFLLTHRA